MTDPCACGNPQQADFYLEGVLGRGNSRTGTETEELSHYSCAPHANKAAVKAALKIRDQEDPAGLAALGRWTILEFRKRPLRGRR